MSIETSMEDIRPVKFGKVSFNFQKKICFKSHFFWHSRLMRMPMQERSKSNLIKMEKQNFKGDNISLENLMTETQVVVFVENFAFE